MAWNLPAVFVSGATLLASQLNQIRDSLNAIGTPTSYVPSWTNVTLGTTGLVNTAEYSEAGKWITVHFTLTLGTGGSASAAILMSIPFPPADTNLLALGTVMFNDASVGQPGRRVGVVVQSGAAVGFYLAGDDAGNKVVSTSVPFTWAAGDTMAGTFTYEAA